MADTGTWIEGEQDRLSGQISRLFPQAIIRRIDWYGGYFVGVDFRMTVYLSREPSETEKDSLRSSFRAVKLNSFHGVRRGQLRYHVMGQTRYHDPVLVRD